PPGPSPSLSHAAVALATAPSGYWVAAVDGTVANLGGAPPHGSVASARPVVGIAGTPAGGGYWLVASDGGVLALGDAPFLGSTGAIHLNQPIVGMAAGPGGYWLVASDGGIFSLGNVTFYGS